MPGTSRKHLTREEKRRLDQLIPRYMRGELTQVDLARMLRRSRPTIHSYLKKSGAVKRQPRDIEKEQDAPDPIKYEDLSPEARAAWDDFSTFYQTYIGPTLDGYEGIAAFQIELVKLLHEGKHRRIIVNMPPGHGKTTLLLAYLLWRIVRDRQIRTVFITKSQELAKDAVGWLQGQMTENEKLIQAFGFFRTEDGLWQRGKFHVAGASMMAKAATVAAYGQGTSVMGTRPSLILADDVIDEKTSRIEGDRNRIQEWWHANVERRLEVWKTGATLAVIGQRLATEDLYGHLAGILDDKDQPIYHLFRLPAHDETKCPGDGTHPAQPQGCTLWPERWPYEELMIARAQMNAGRPGDFELVYQQQDIPQEDALVPRAWIFGGVDPTDGQQVPGCLDLDRAIGQCPPNKPGLLSVITIDPSQTGFWGVHWWLWEAAERADLLPTWHLYRTLRQRMKGEAEMLDFTPAPKGILEDWWNESVKAGMPLRHIVVERNLIRQSSFLQGYQQTQWTRSRGIRVLEHETNVNKHGDLGVWHLRSRFLPGKVRIPYANPVSRAAVEPFITELTHYTEPKTYKTDDTVMSAWFLLYNERRIHRVGQVSGFDARPIPAFAQRLRYLVDPATGARRTA